MGSKHSRRRGDRIRSIESLEDRRVMSADPLLGGAVQHPTHSDSFSEPPALVHHLERDADFWMDVRSERDIEALLGELEQTLASAHGLTGLTQARNDYGFIGTGQTVAIIDSGIAWDHTALGGGYGANYRVVGGWDFTEENDNRPYDDGPYGGHGTHVAGIVGADRTSATDDGVAPGVDLVSLRVFNDAGEGYFSWVENALRWVYQNRNTFANRITAVNLSLGTNWNAASIPSWAMLEEEFAQLKSVGIFITVSAGNSFASYNTTGLSYPAASPYVVPVMSVDDSGNLSSFSQRHSSAIAAPGRYIVSTVPDYIGNHNGVTDDYASFSGTSMAAPYVAGASVILREAMQFVGYANITQDTIFNHMMATATSFFDAATNQNYKRLNLANALNALMPSDDYGSTAAMAYNLGTLSGTSEIAGLIGKLSDADYFRFTAAATGTVSFTAATTHGLAPVWTASGGGAVSGSRGETFTFDVVAGQTYTLGLSTSGGIGYYTLAIDAQSGFTFTDLGAVVQTSFNDQNIAGETWYRVEARQAGYFTAEAFFNGAAGKIDVAWFDANLQQVASGVGSKMSMRVDRLVNPGEELYLRVRGVNADVDFRLTNLVSLAGSTLTINGTSSADVVTFTAGRTQHLVSVNGVNYQFKSAAVTEVNLSGGTDRDSVTIVGSSAAESVVIQLGQMTISGGRFSLSATDFEDVLVYTGGGRDSAVLYDTAGDDQLTLWARRARLVGDGFTHELRNFQQVNAYATSGYDRTTFYDSAADDIFTAWPDRAMMRTSSYVNTAWGFDRTAAHATAGGYDRAVFYDSAGDDVYTAMADRAAMQGDEFYHIAWAFERTAAYATAGYDQAVFFDSPGNDLYTAMVDRAVMQGPKFYNIGWNFETTTAHSVAGGTDKAVFYDSIGDDLFAATPERASMQGTNFFNAAWGFKRTTAYATAGGYDRATLYDSTGDDNLVSATWGAYLSGINFRNEARGFEEISASLTAGGKDAWSIAATDYLFSLAGQN